MARKPRPKKTEEERAYWKGVWTRAVENMPIRTSTLYQIHIVKAGPMSVVVYGWLLSRQNVSLNKNGVRERKVVTAYRILNYSSRKLLLNALMGNFDKHSGNRFFNGVHRGYAPKHPIQRQRLLDLAERGNSIAWEYLHLVGKEHLFTDDLSSGEIYTIVNPKHLKKYERRRI